MKRAYRVDRRDPDRARTEVTRVWRDNMSVECDIDAKFSWTFPADEPHSSSVFILGTGDDGREVVGAASVVERRFLVDGRLLRSALAAELAVDSAHRTGMPAIRLVRHVRQASVCEFGFAYGFPNGQAAPIFLRCGYHELGKVVRYARVLRHGRYLAGRMPPPLASALGLGADLARRAAHGPAAHRASRDHELVWLREVDDRFDRLWEQARRSYRVIAERTARFLRWRFLRHPEQTYRVVGLCRTRGDRELLAYAVLSFGDDVAGVHDFFGAPDDLGRLFDLLIPAVARLDASSISAQFLGDPRVAEVLRRRGFSARESRRPVVVSPGLDTGGRDRSIVDSTRWFLTDADHEWW